MLEQSSPQIRRAADVEDGVPAKIRCEKMKEIDATDLGRHASDLRGAEAKRPDPGQVDYFATAIVHK